jgi:hypothetical protein
VELVAGHGLKEACHVRWPRQEVLGEPLAVVQDYKTAGTKAVPREYKFEGFVGQERRAVMIFPTSEEEILEISACHHQSSLEYLS